MPNMTNLRYWYCTSTLAVRKKFKEDFKQQTALDESTMYRYIRGEQMASKAVNAIISSLTNIAANELYKDKYTS